ncbi:MAG: DMT family transporter [Candidatus Pacebacteria bacterium]|nr:DMT family transporter [Candidatus Paceibacterota bacterium]PIR60887.1 MAG: EamA family transporter [Candidatus Pacebacteria bacterium CG10_big_fil_rev_8_21_14_0_10_44_54]
MLRRSLYSLPPITIVFLETLIGSIILLPVFVRQLNKEKITRLGLVQAAAVALLSGLLGTLWFTAALVKVNFISLSVVFLLQKLQPLFAISTARIFLRESLPKSFVIWAGVALVAAYFVTFPGGVVNLNTGAGTAHAALLALGAAAAWGSSTTLSKSLLTKQSGAMSTSLRFFITTALAGGALLLFGQSSSIAQVTPPQIGMLTLIAVSTGMVALYIYYQGLKRTQAKVATILELTFPLLAIVIDAFVYKIFLSPIQLIAAVVLLFAILRVGKTKLFFDDC